jgi:hypothetical protein
MYTKLDLELFRLIALYIYNGHTDEAGKLLEEYFGIKE